MATLTSIIEKAKELGEVTKVAYDAIVEVEDKSSQYEGEAKTAYVCAVVADEVGEEIDTVSVELTEFINEVVEFLNDYSWASKVVAVLATILHTLQYVPSIFGWASSVIARGAELYFEIKTGLDLDKGTGEVK